MHLYQFNSKEEWLNARHDYITASEIGCLLGLDSYKSLPILVKEKREKVNLAESTLKMRFGNLMEKVALRCFELKTGFELQMFDNNLAVNNEYPRIACSLDGLHNGDELIVVDAKVSSGDACWQWGNKDNPCGVPHKYYAQMQTQMLITGAPISYLAVLKKEKEVTEVDYAGLEHLVNDVYRLSNPFESRHLDYIVKMLYASGYTFDAYFVPRDVMFQENIVTAVDEFYDYYIFGDKQPIVTTAEEVKALAITPIGKLAVDEELYERLVEFNTLNTKRKALENSCKKLSDKLKIDLALWNEGEYNGKKVFGYSMSNPKLKFDEDRFKQEHPELYNSYLTTSNPTRTFTVNIK